MGKTYADLLQEVKGAIRQVSLEDLKSRLDSGEEDTVHVEQVLDYNQDPEYLKE